MGDQHGMKRHVTSGLRRTQPVQTGPRGAFVPPFVKKAMEGPKDEQAQGALSAKTLEMLGGNCSVFLTTLGRKRTAGAV